jgi:O-antigen/teichoic acid export membrane protein
MLVAGLPSLPLGMLSLTLIPRFARHYHNGHLEESQRLARNASTLIFLIAVGLSAGLLIASPAIPRILGAPWQAVTTLLPALLLASLVDCLTGPTMPVMQTTGMERTYSCLFLVYVPVQLLLLYGLSQWAGVQGAAVAYLLGRCLWNLLVTTLIYRQRSLVMLPALESLREGLSRLRR